jgi:ubiquinone/menaquinone biosynthesis C-methylase UbiE
MNPAEFQKIAASEERMWWFAGMREILNVILDQLPRTAPLNDVLEAGCGTGMNAKLLAERYGWRITPVDLAMEGLAVGRRYGVERLVQADLRSLPFAAASFDAVLSLDVLVHFEAGGEGAALREFHRVLKPGGLVVLRVSALPVLRSRHSEYVGERQRFTRLGLRRTLAAAGFHLHRLTYANALLLPVALAKFRLWEPLFQRTPASGVETPAAWLNRLLTLPLNAEAHWLRRGGSFVLGQSLIAVAQKGGRK